MPTSPATLPTDTTPVVRHTFDNGLRLVVSEDHLAPVVQRATSALATSARGVRAWRTCSST